MPEKENISVRSEEFQDILGKMPGWITRNGITLVFVCVLIFLIGSWFFKYPDVISSSVVVTTENPPANLIARSTGQIKSLFVEDGQKVNNGDILAVIENPGRYDHVLSLRKILLDNQELINQKKFDEFESFGSNYRLGEVQSDYSSFIKELNDYKFFVELNYHPRKLKSLKEQLKVVGQNVDRTKGQVDAIRKEYVILNTQFKRDSSLYSREVLSVSDFEKSKASLLSKKFEVEGAQANLAKMRLSYIELDQKVIDSEKDFYDETSAYELKIIEAYNNLLSAISSWELKYVLQAPVDGEISFNKYWSETQNVKEGEVVMTVIPELPSRIIGKVELPIKGSGKVKIGQKVNIKFDNYPYLEYGLVRGVVKNISLIPTNDVYMVELEFPNGLVTNYNVSLELSREIKGTAEIITDELRLLQRFFNPLKSLFKERMMN